MTDCTQHNPLAHLTATGRRYISPCCTASVEEYRDASGTLWLVGHVAGHGYGRAWQGSIAEINDAGTLVEADGTERRVQYDPKKDEATTISGRIMLKGGHVFFWMIASDGEIRGHIERPQGGVLPKSSGWWRTTNPERAAELAELQFLSNI